ncbi:MAG TPA: leucine-rich repeat domain-containing protein [Methylomirabilota bacterium]|nr:leucine-rich repeat domain-containing protein [Methylomirabilota bacterium]
MIEAASVKGSKEFAPGLEMSPEFWKEIVTLPTTIAKLTSVKRLYLYGSNLVRIPPEIGAMENLEELDIYTSYRLHWLPYEVTRCRKLKRSRASTRALYGNYKYRPPFPTLGAVGNSGTCSACNRRLSAEFLRQVWISLFVATDVVPLLVNACSEECLERLPRPAFGYVEHPLTGGLQVKQPPVSHGPPQL